MQFLFQYPTDCWPGHLDMWEIWQNRQEATWPVFTITWITFCCCQPGIAASPLRLWFSLLSSSVALCHLHFKSLLLQWLRAISIHSPNTDGVPTLSLVLGLLLGLEWCPKEMWFLPPELKVYWARQVTCHSSLQTVLNAIKGNMRDLNRGTNLDGGVWGRAQAMLPADVNLKLPPKGWGKGCRV